MSSSQLSLVAKARTVLMVLAATFAFAAPHDFAATRFAVPTSESRDLFIMFSAIAPREAPRVFKRYFSRRDYARIESLPPELRLPRSHRYVLPTTLRRRWADEPGLRYWTGRGCGPRTPGTIIYDPERRNLTPIEEQEAFPRSVRQAARLVQSTGCHVFGLAPGSTFLFGFDADACSYDLKKGFYRKIPWRSVDILDIQAQRLLGDDCIANGGVGKYASVVSSIAAFVRRRNPDIAVVSQVSFRDSPPLRMQEAIATVADDIDGIYFSYPSTHPNTPCRYCSPVNLATFLKFLRG